MKKKFFTEIQSHFLKKAKTPQRGNLNSSGPPESMPGTMYPLNPPLVGPEPNWPA